MCVELILQLQLLIKRRSLLCNGSFGTQRPMILFSSTVILFLHQFGYHFLIPQLDSGHGGQTKDVDGDEGDGQDEGSPVRDAIS